MRVREVIAIDVGTASLSAALAKKESLEHIEVVSVLRYPIDFFSSQDGFINRNRIPYLIKKSIAHCMADAHKALLGAETISVSVSEPFFQQHLARKIIQRERPNDRVSREELDNINASFVADAETGIATFSRLLRAVRRGTRRAWINGYELRNPVGYRGAELEIEIEMLLMSKTLIDCLEEFRSIWFPRAIMRYYTDPEMLGRILLASFSLSLPALLIDVGGEVTGITVVSDKATQTPCGPVFFGVRTIERRITEFARCDMAHAESILRRYVSQTLDAHEASRLEPFLEVVVSEWRSLVAQSFHKTYTGTIRSIFLAGQGRDIQIFHNVIERRITDFASSPVELHDLTVSLDQLSPPKILNGGGYSVLASLLLYA